MIVTANDREYTSFSPNKILHAEGAVKWSKCLYANLMFHLFLEYWMQADNIKNLLDQYFNTTKIAIASGHSTYDIIMVVVKLTQKTTDNIDNTNNVDLYVTSK